ncbi:Methyltransf-11 domain-containing protein [Fusarium falciforme]|uniref:Methyltransf-11 domain-containing protein n=1 Tax=Fusarium falciforme TaxID=195108 RepID=UPI0023016B1B|nr:Methyltransf-11 domain-containing protein [Fusarium falciforme]WAO96002.1 Methyltransf-11 domain-containing protein [Fusarium falciforme]
MVVDLRKMPQNIYDNGKFFAEYAALDRSVNGLGSAPEWPRMQSYLPDLKGLSVIDLGCGFGWFARWARKAGAEFVCGIDISQNMLDRAQAMTDDPNIRYERGDMDSLMLPESCENRYEVAFSSLTIHYLAHLAEFAKHVHRSLKRGGLFVFSVEHPVYTAPSHPAFITDEASGREYWPLDSYHKEGMRLTKWLIEGVEKHHRTVATYINTFLQAGFELTGFDEWRPTPEELKTYPYSGHRVLQRPVYLVMAVRKK